jgi:hypothetical protein
MKMLGQGIDILYISRREVKAGMVKAVALKWQYWWHTRLVRDHVTGIRVPTLVSRIYLRLPSQ